MSDRLIEAYRGAASARSMSRGLIKNLVTWDRRDLADLERRYLGLDKKQGRRGINNAHKATHNVLAAESRKIIAGVAMAPSRSIGKRAQARRTQFERSRKENRKAANTKSFRKGVQAKGNWKFRATFKPGGVVSRSWLSSKFYNRFIGHFFEGGFRPGGRGSRIRATRWRFGPARRPDANKRFAARVTKAITTQMSLGKTLTPKELERVV